jgi:SSS family solute:Na+ symporter
MAYKGKWNYRSGVLTNMEWVIFRYGDDRAGSAARLVNVIVVLILTILMLGYAGTGVGKFFQEFIPIDKNILIPLLFSLTGLYVILNGFFSVVYSDFFQTTLLSLGAVYISILAFLKIDPEIFRNAVGNEWFSISPLWKLPTSPAGYQDAFELLVILWVTKGVISLFSQGADSSGTEFQRFRAARNEADASKAALAWGIVFSVRWALVMAFTVFGLSNLSNQSGAIDSERVLPMVLNRVLPVGIKGLVLAGLIAAFMSTFDSTLNVAASYIVNDLIKPVWKKATPKKLMIMSYFSTFMILVFGIVISLQTEQIRDIWNPINFALGSSLIVPALLAPYWWRIGGWTHCASGILTLIAAFVVYFFTDWNELRYFPVLSGISLVSCLIFSFLFPPASNNALKNYFRRIRPFGFWKPVRQMLEESGEDTSRFARDRLDIPNAIVATFFFIFLYLFMMDLVLHNWNRVLSLLILLLGGGLILYFNWLKRLIFSEKIKVSTDDKTTKD